ncbi:MAG: hypothetical protein KAH22_08650 [Thiotrichaceae bacterium]|nr:hypothetical protein [Thiotrichaceae bacterium]
MFTASNFLALHPVNASNTISLEHISHKLLEIKFINKQEATWRFELGDKFLSYITFLGCSPDIELSPHPSKPYSYITLSSTNNIQFHSGKNIKIPHCKHCKKSLDGSITLLKNNPIKQPINCLHCHHEVDILRLNWRKSGFFAHCAIYIGNIYEAEAVPTESLLAKLLEISGFEWKYSYLRQPI